MSKTFTAKRDSRCGNCGETISEGDEIKYTPDSAEIHADCESPAADVSTVAIQWATAESVSRADLETLEEARVAPLGKQGKCPVCHLELPLTRLCDDHGRVRA
jgi:hypothetical protein